MELGKDVKFIALEGPECSGKSTVIHHLAEYITERFKLKVLISKEPGGTAIGHMIRQIVKNKDFKDTMCPDTDACLYLADRVQHCHEVINPMYDEENPAKYDIVLSDRSAYTSFAIQCGAFGFDHIKLLQMHELMCPRWKPDFVVYLDISTDTVFERFAKASDSRNDQNSRFEQYEREFHTKVRQTYREMVAKNPGEWIFVDAEKPVSEVMHAIHMNFSQIFI